MVTIRTFNSFAEAGLAKAELESAGISATIADEHAYTLGYPVGGVRLQVAETDVVNAKSILESHEGFLPLPDDFVPPEVESDATTPVQSAAPSARRGALAAFVSWGLGTLLAFGLLVLVGSIVGIRAHANPGGVLLLFVIGGILGVVARAIRSRG